RHERRRADDDPADVRLRRRQGRALRRGAGREGVPAGDGEGGVEVRDRGGRGQEGGLRGGSPGGPGSRGRAGKEGVRRQVRGGGRGHEIPAGPVRGEAAEALPGRGQVGRGRGPGDGDAGRREGPAGEAGQEGRPLVPGERLEQVRRKRN